MAKTAPSPARDSAAPAPKPKPRPSRVGKSVLIFVVAALVVGGAVAAYFIFRAPTVTPVAPQDLESLHRELREFVRGKYEAALKKLDDAKAQTDLALACHFNNLLRASLPNMRNVALLLPDDPKPLHYAATCFHEFGDLDAAFDGYDAVCRKFPDFAPSFYERGVLRLNRGDLDGAEQDFERVRTIEPLSADGWIGGGDVAVRKRDYAKAEQLLRRALDIDPNEKTTSYQLGLALRGLGRREEAEKRLAAGSGSTSRHMKDAWSVRRVEFSKSVSDLTSSAIVQLRRGGANYAAGLSVLEKLLADNPDNIEVLINLGGAYQDGKRYEKALELFERALKIDPNKDSTLINMSAVLLNLQRYKEALVFAEKATKAAPEQSIAWLNKGHILRRLRRDDEAISAYKNAIRFDATAGMPHYAIGAIYFDQKRTEDARTHLEAGSRLSPNYVTGLVLLAEFRLSTGDRPGAEAAFAAARKIDPGSPEVAEFAQRLR